MKQFIILVFSLFFTASLAAGAADGISRLNSLLSVYQQADGQQRLDAGRAVISLQAGQDELVSQPLSLSERMPSDSVDFLVWFAAERFYFVNSYFEECLAYIDRALPLVEDGPGEGHLQSKNSPELHATLLCDRGYCLFKTGRNAEATEAELKAERYAREHGLLLPLARSYNYLAIINISLGYTDEAKHFVQKAIETDARTGSDVNTHNYLGIACEVYNVANEPDRAVEYGQQAVEAARKIGYDAGVVNHLSQLSYAYNRQGNLEKALAMSREAVATVERMPIVDRNLLAISLEYVAFNLLDMKRHDEAVPVIRRAIALEQEVGNTRSVCYDHKTLAEALEPSDPRGALAAMRRYSTMMDSLHNDEMHAVLSRANAQLRNDELQDENAQQRRQNRYILISSIIIGLLALGAIASLVYAVRTRNRSIRTMHRLQTVREEFFTNITHEFRTPLTVIRGMAEQQDIPAITRNADQLLTLVNQLLDVAKVKTSVGNASWQRTDIIPLLTMLVESHQEEARSRGITLTFRPEAETTVIDHVADYAQKVVDNLLTNAMKYTPEGGTVTLSTHVEGQRLQLIVTDNGQGIHPDDLPHIFEPFYQSRHQPAAPGSGIGLAFCRELIEASHGTITAKSTLGQGSTFTVVMPLRQKDITPAQPAVVVDLRTDKAKLPPPISYTPDNEKDSSIKRVLVVEDNRDVAAYIGSVLEPNYEVVYATDGEEGLAKAEELMPDVILTDVMMPTMDGLELCRRIRANYITDHIPVIIITARVTDDDRLRGIEAGADAYLTKPFRADELLLRITKLLEQRRRLLEKGGTTTQSPAEEEAPAAPPEKGRFLQKLDAIIDSQMSKSELKVSTIVQEIGMSTMQLSRKLNALVGLSPGNYITERRMEKARQMLDEWPKYNISEVGTYCGYTDLANFSHAFRRVCGISPMQYVKGETPQ